MKNLNPRSFRLVILFLGTMGLTSTRVYAEESSNVEFCFNEDQICFLVTNSDEGRQIYTVEEDEIGLYEKSNVLASNFEFEVIEDQKYASLKKAVSHVINLFTEKNNNGVAFSDCDNTSCDPQEVVKEALVDGVVAGASGAAYGGYTGAATGTFAVPGVGTVAGGFGGAALGGTVGFIGGFSAGICEGIVRCSIDSATSSANGSKSHKLMEIVILICDKNAHKVS